MDIATIIAEQDARAAALDARVDTLDREDRKLYRFECRDGIGPIVVSRDPSKPGAWRITWFDREGPCGHSEAPSRVVALRRAAVDYRAVL